MSAFEEIELSAAVRAVREELALATQQGSGSAVRFEVGPIQMEFAVEFRREAGAKGGVKAWVFSSDLEAKAARATTHRISFTLTPKDAATGRDLEIGDTDPGGTAHFGGGDN